MADGGAGFDHLPAGIHRQWPAGATALTVACIDERAGGRDLVYLVWPSHYGPRITVAEVVYSYSFRYPAALHGDAAPDTTGGVGSAPSANLQKTSANILTISSGALSLVSPSYT